MGERYEARIGIESRVGAEAFDRTVNGVVYRKLGKWYLRYEETDDEGGITSTVVKFGDHEWTVRRSGIVQSHMTFALDRAFEGYYRSAGIELSLTTVMRSSRFEIDAGKGVISWDYDLFISGESAAQHSLTFRIS